MADNPRGKGYGLHMDEGKVHFHLTSGYADDALRVETEEKLEADRWYAVTATYNGSRMADGVRIYIDGKPAKVKVLLDTLYRPFNNAGSDFKQPLRIGGGWGEKRRFNGGIGEVRLYGRVVDEFEIGALASTATVQQVAAKPVAARTDVERRMLLNFYLEKEAAPEIREAWRRLTQLELDRLALERTFPTVMVMAESQPRKDTYFLNRGEYNKHGDKVEPGVPAVLPPLPADAPNNRLGFAQWLTDPGNPLLARVTVNRFWQGLFGVGIVETVEDFGSQGDWPSHPELLDWLATEFISSGWNTKALLKTIVMSSDLPTVVEHNT